MTIIETRGLLHIKMECFVCRKRRDTAEEMEDRLKAMERELAQLKLRLTKNEL